LPAFATFESARIDGTGIQNGEDHGGGKFVGQVRRNIIQPVGQFVLKRKFNFADQKV
jgi:hypothetical protein